MILLAEMLDLGELDEMLASRLVKRVASEDGRLWILNYTSRAQYQQVWNDTTRACRGLIVERTVDADGEVGYGRVVARPWRKFFNLGDADAAVDVNAVDGRVVVTEKLDGSLAVAYRHDGEVRFASRGSFTSEQARRAQQLWDERVAGGSRLRDDWTYLCEVVYPENRVVVDYQGVQDLVLLGAVETATGRSVPLEDARAGWGGSVVAEHPFETLAEVLMAGERENAEGYVVWFSETDERVKIKHEQYVVLHRLVTDTSERRVWEALSSGRGIDDVLDAVPDEAYAVVQGWRDGLMKRYAEQEQELLARYAQVLAVAGDADRRAFAEAAKAHGEWAGLLFAHHDRKGTTAGLWTRVRPERHEPLYGANLDAE
jgi:RNA ligase